MRQPLDRALVLGRAERARRAARGQHQARQGDRRHPLRAGWTGDRRSHSTWIFEL